ncbi:unnamed protein product [Urochloa humidicola]
MAGGDDCSLRRCTAKSVEAAAAASGPQSSLTSCSTKRKAKKEAAASSGRVQRPRSTRRKAKEEAAAAEKAAGVKNRLSEKEIKWFLAQKPKPPPPIYQALKRSNPELTPRPEEEGDESKVRLYFLARAFYELEERLPKMQEWVRKELESKGYVEVDDEYHERKAKVQAVIDREWPEIEAKVRAIRLSQGCDESESCDESDSEDDE